MKGEGILRRMKKMMVLGALALSAATVLAQESRQDVSLSGTVPISPQVNGNAVQLNATKTLGLLASYRYMLTPRSALEVNYGYAQNSNKFIVSFANARVHTLQQEFSAAYVFSLNFRNFNPFAEAGAGAYTFTPLYDAGTTYKDAKTNTNLGGLFGVGVAYEISPSFDIRAEYRGFVTKAPDFKEPQNEFKTNRYEVLSTPAIGIAYHF